MPRRTRGKSLEPIDPEIERTAHHLRKASKVRRRIQMGEERPINEEMPPPPPPPPPGRMTMRSFANLNMTAINRGIQAPAVGANNFEIKYGTTQMLQQKQFGGAPTEDSHAHLLTFEKICNTFKINGVSDDTVKLRLFNFSLKGRAHIWEESLPTDQIHTWADMTTTFLHKFFPPGRTTQLMAEITHFVQWDQETLYEAWERYKNMLKKCPHHGLHSWVIIQTFFGGLHQQYKNDITVAAGGALMNKTYEETVELIENLAEHNYDAPQSDTRSIANVQESDELKVIKAQLAAITNQLK
ncbi:hypothetical protein L6452_15820 [Arctium lappa]|uniref:Uncharacterized protein n=1 Tax=Arctium lappa TaxID=4217 RepID=A0ACB9CPX7_ARCLA|nr:hypothetical protein L6452_15820 [Arctium lappa]